MTSQLPIRVRFAPSPTGMMHLGNVRAVLMNYLFAKQKNGTFILRIEDTDQQRNVDAYVTGILDDILWLKLDYEEGPIKGGHYEPYFQSQRNSIYQEKLTVLQHRELVYRCFCSTEELEKKRQRQIALKQPPRYDRTCLHLSTEEIKTNLDANKPFIWRFKLSEGTIQIHDMARGAITFDMKHFSDFALTRQDGTFTFMFANFVDDMVMVISHVIRGEDHLTNTAGQAALYHAFNIPLPMFWHLPIIGNAMGQKLSKRDFGFSLNDLRAAGYLSEAICNYLAIIGGGSFEQEIMPLEDLVRAVNFDTLSATGQIRYDIEKLRWLNHKWIEKLDIADLTKRCLPFLQTRYLNQSFDEKKIVTLVAALRTDLITLADVADVLHFYFHAPEIDEYQLQETIPQEFIAPLKEIARNNIASIASEGATHFVDRIKQDAQKQSIQIKYLFWFIRLCLTGKAHGPAVHELIDMIGTGEAIKRIEQVINK
ncbi:MAG: glutamate--tRNA ligase [Candidatus Dependentiae bacterium]|nr:glutamate--tRNA ligase [Candidatus Dependentiae bacterium]